MTTAISITIDDSGIHTPDFTTVLQYVQDTYRSIYGQDIDIDPDTQDGQLIGVLSTLMSDMNSACVAAFNSFRPAAAVGAGLSSIVKINGIARRSATASQVTITLGGTAFTVIPSGALVGDNLNLNTQWFIMLAPITIPAVGQIDVVAYCTTPGAVTAGPGTLTQILTPVPGWQTVTNAAAAVTGQPVETDAALRRRQTQSTALPALTVLESIEGNLLALPDVIRAKVYQNDTGATDVNGIPPRSISAVIEGGTPNEIGRTIAQAKAPGVPTYGNILVTVYDQYGIPNTINYFALTQLAVTLLVFINPVYGYTDQVGGYIQASLAQFLNDLDIGESIYLGDLFSPARLNGDEAMAATGLPQSQLDTLEPSYTIAMPYGMAIARPDMVATGGPYASGTNIINVQVPAYYAVGSVIWLTLDDFSYFRSVVTAMAGTQLTFADPIPSQRSVVAGALIFAVGDVAVQFNEAATATPASVLLQLLP
jgi:uncharacterized phage protein gp47/JayE